MSAVNVAFGSYTTTRTSSAAVTRRERPNRGLKAREDVVLLSQCCRRPGPLVVCRRQLRRSAEGSVNVRSVLEVVESQEGEIPAIGTLNEGALHAQLKNW